MSAKMGVGLFGNNAHQVQRQLVANPLAELVAIAEIGQESLPAALRGRPDITAYPTLDALIADPRVELVSLCSPVRAEQARQAIACLNAGKHVYAEKPCAMTEDELDEVIQVAERTGKHFHEMAGTAFEQPYVAMGAVVESGVLGEIVQVFAQKSYPYHDRRPQDEDIDGGLTAQVGIHAFRMIEHVAGLRIVKIHTLETQLGNPKDGDLKMASSLMLQLENGGVASIVVNYLNQSGLGSWGNEHLRIFGTKGFVEATDGGKRTRLIVGAEDRGALDTSVPTTDYFDKYLALLVNGTPMPLTLEAELHPTRLTIRARNSAVLV